ncbi:hypothetical protein G7Y89_g4247 [Cudoniella acicularis]|uniref:glutathione transferase n=1 Tax=Cudoniella acicularis TaxID=354080 RepID=A0A8H4RQN9_9HELO|nr:hypothetical protein G7Y89_g4247 [Cudoniella acicularis]
MQFQFQLLAAFASLAAARNVLIAAPGGADFFTQEVISNWALMPEDLGTWEACYWDGTAPFYTSTRPANVPCDKLTLFVVKGDIIEELGILHDVYVVGSPGKEEWFRKVNPCGMIPALEDFADDSGESGSKDNRERMSIWESTSCLYYLVARYDKTGLLSGRTLFEKTQVKNWMTLHTAALGATAKWWLWFKTLHPETIGNTLDKLSNSIKEQYSILDKRLAEEGQEYIALKDRPTIADFVNLPFANAQIASTAGYDFGDWPHLKAWSEKMLTRPAVSRALVRVQSFGIDPEEKKNK